MSNRFPLAKDRALIQIVDSALADASQRSGKWLFVAYENINE